MTARALSLSRRQTRVTDGRVARGVWGCDGRRNGGLLATAARASVARSAPAALGAALARRERRAATLALGRQVLQPVDERQGSPRPAVSAHQGQRDVLVFGLLSSLCKHGSVDFLVRFHTSRWYALRVCCEFFFCMSDFVRLNLEFCM